MRDEEEEVMADWKGMELSRVQAEMVWQLVAQIRNGYAALASVAGRVADYQAGSPELVAAINAVLTQAQRAELAQVAVKMSALATDLAANHKSLAGG